MAGNPLEAHAAQSEAIAEQQLRSWFQNQVRTTDGLLRKGVGDLTALRGMMELEHWGTALDNVMLARRTLEDASAAVDEAALRVEAALRLVGPVAAAAAAGGVPPWSEYLHHGAWGGGQRVVPYLTAAARHLDRAQNCLTDCCIRVRAMTHYFTGGALGQQAVPVVHVDPALAAVARFDELRALGMLVTAIRFVVQAVESAGVARYTLMV